MSLIAWYPLNGTLEDYSGNKYTLQNNGASIDNSGKIGKCYSFNNNNIIITKNPTTSDTFSISLWVYKTSSANGCLYNTRTVMGNGVSFFYII